MQTNAEYFATMTVPMLKARLTLMNVAGISKSRKAELVNTLAVLIDGFHLDAIAEQDAKDAAMLAAVEAMVDEAFPPSKAELEAAMNTRPRSYNERMVARIEGYLTQTGHGAKLATPEYGSYDSPMMMSFLTAAQRRRVAKKTGRQYAKLVANVAR